MSNRIISTIIGIAFFLGLGVCFGQSSDFENNNMFYEHKIRNCVLGTTDEGIDILLSTKERRRFNETLPSESATDYVTSSSFREVSNLSASISYPKGNGRYTTQKALDIAERSDFSGNIFYDDDHYFEIRFPNTSPGSYTDVFYNTIVNDPHFFDSFFFTEYFPVKSATYEIVADTTIDIGWQIFGMEKDSVKFTRTVDNGSQTLTWTLENVAAFKSMDNHPGYSHVATHILVYIKSFTTLQGEKKNVLGNLDELYNWNYSLLKKIKQEETDELSKITHELIEGATTDLEKAERIFNWVQDNIRYIAIEDG